MTTTLLKHEWLRTRGALGMFFGVVVLVGILGSLLGVTGWAVLSMLGLLLGVLAVLAVVPGVQLLLAADYWRSGYGRTGYFTQSIPVRGSTIFWAKLLWAVVVTVVAMVLTLALGWLVWWAVAVNGDFTRPTPEVIGSVVEALFDVAPVWMIIAGAVLVPVWVMTASVYYYFSVSVGHESRLASLGIGGPIVVFVVLYVCTQILSLLAMVVIPFGLGSDGERVAVVPFNLLEEMSTASGTGSVMPLGFVVMLLLLAVFCLWRTVRSWNHKVALR